MTWITQDSILPAKMINGEYRGPWKKKEQHHSCRPTGIYLYFVSFGLPTFLKRIALPFSSQLYSHLTVAYSHSNSHSEWLSRRQCYKARQGDWVPVCFLGLVHHETLCVVFRCKPEKLQESPHGMRTSPPPGKQSQHPDGTHWPFGSSFSALTLQLCDKIPSPIFLLRQF